MKSIRILPVKSKRELSQFIKLPWTIYRDNSNWVPHLIVERKETLSKTKNPFFNHGDIQLFIAIKNAKVVGRIAAIRNDMHNQFHHDKVGFYGFFECINDQEVANNLLDAARNWIAKLGFDTMLGPVSPSSNYEWGVLIAGFDKRPSFLMPYNPSYYQLLLEGYGLSKVKDLFAYRVHSSALLAEEIFRQRTDRVKNRFKIILRKLDKKRFDDDLRKFQEIYDLTWANNWGFVPFSDKEIHRLGKLLKPLIDTDLAIFAEIDGEIIGAVLTIPDLNPALQKMNGKIFPFGIVKFLSHRSRIDSARIMALGVIPKYQSKGIDALLYYEVAKRGNAKGIDVGEASWILENNTMMNRGVKLMKGELSKSYRIYGCSVQDSDAVNLKSRSQMNS